MRLLAFFLPLLLLMMPAPARADLVMHNRDKTSSMHLLETPCSHGETMALLAEEWRPRFKNLRILSTVA